MKSKIQFTNLQISESSFGKCDFSNFETVEIRHTGKPIIKLKIYVYQSSKVAWKGQAREINENTEDELKRLRNVATVPKINGQYLVLFLGCFGVAQNRRHKPEQKQPISRQLRGQGLVLFLGLYFNRKYTV